MKRLATAIMSLCLALPSFAEDGGSYSAYTPYSVFGIGELAMPGTAYNRTMGGVGIASRNHRYVNILNPAAVTARDSLAFMSDFSIYQSNKVLRQEDRTSASNMFNINDFVISFPVLYTKPADISMMLGIKPYSSVGYSSGYYETNKGVLATGDIVGNSFTGLGSIYQLFGAVGVELFDKVSLGVEATHYFGNITRTYTQSHSDDAALGITETTELALRANTLKFGLQYEFNISDKTSIGLGAIYSLDTKLNGYIDGSTVSGDASISSFSDTLNTTTSPVYIAGEKGIGISLKYGEKFRAEVDYTRSDWSNSGFSSVRGFGNDEVSIFSTGLSQSVRAGVEYIPNPGDIRYYHKLIAYRAGVYYNQENFSVSDNQIWSAGITFGATLPVFRWSNGVTLGMDIGRRGTVQNSLIRETYVSFSLVINLFDIWFQQPKYE